MKKTQQISRKLLKMDVLTFETCWAVNSEIIKQVISSWSIFIQRHLCIPCHSCSVWCLNAFFGDPKTHSCFWFHYNEFWWMQWLISRFDLACSSLCWLSFVVAWNVTSIVKVIFFSFHQNRWTHFQSAFVAKWHVVLKLVTILAESLENKPKQLKVSDRELLLIPFDVQLTFHREKFL